MKTINLPILGINDSKDLQIMKNSSKLEVRISEWNGNKLEEGKIDISETSVKYRVHQK